MKPLLLLLLTLFGCYTTASAINRYDNPDTLIVAHDSTGQFHNIGDALEVCRAFMDYHKVIYVKKGTYHEKIVVPSWLTNIEICGESRDSTIITWADHANLYLPGTTHPMGTFRTYTLKIEGSHITLRNITVANSSAPLGQAVALHTEGDALRFINCRFLGHQDTIYTGAANTHLYFYNCYIEGTTDFIFGPSMAWFEHCHIHSKANSYITAASTPASQAYGYIFYQCQLTADKGINQVYLGRPWRPYAYTLFIDCELGRHIRPEGWHNWNNKANEHTARYAEYNNHGDGAFTNHRVAWSKLLSSLQAKKIIKQWYPAASSNR